MKKLLTLFVVISTVAIFSSCGDDRPDDLPVSLNASAAKTVATVANANAQTSAKISFTLSDFKALEQYTKWVKKGTIQTSGSAIVISKLSESADVKLTKVNLSLASNSKTNVSLPEISNDITLDELVYLNFLQKVLEEIVDRGSSTVNISFHSSTLISDPFDFTIKLNGRFEF